MKNKLITLSVIAVLATGLSFTGFTSSRAQDAAIEGRAIAATEQVCPATIQLQMRAIQSQYFVDLEAVLESPELTSGQLNDLYQDFIKLKEDLRRVSDIPVIQLESSVSNTSVEQNCSEDYAFIVDQTQNVFVEYVSQITARKRTFVLNEKYDQITEGLTEVQELLHSIETDFSTFETQLPCIIEECIQR